ncbi:MAG TPA: signal peptide peptidase SppA [Devosiaceae bacterium]|nr:signal peptide peptidase SppA [Devosiaceae bacterium]
MTSDTNAPDAHQVTVAYRLQRSRRRWRAIAFLALIVAVLAVAGRFAYQGGGGAQVARVEISGNIATDRDRVELLNKLGEDPSVKAVLISINSPGGTTAGGEELFETIGALRAKKPVVAVIDELGASAAYMTAIAADRVYARRLSIVGSIGVLFQTINAGKLLDTIGIGTEKIASGPLKAEPDLSKPMSPEVRASLTGLVADSFNWFVDIVAQRRGLARPDALALADGRILTGGEALNDKLIDAIGGEDDAIAWLEANKNVAQDLPVVTRTPTGNGWSLGKWFGSEARAALGIGGEGPVALDGLVSLWQVN